MATSDQQREKRRPDRGYYFFVDPDTHEIQRTFGKPTRKPKAKIHLPHYEKSLRIEVDLPDGDPEEVQAKLEEYKGKFIDWFAGDRKKGFMWGNKTRRWAWNNIGMKVQGVKVDKTETRALRTLFMYRGLLEKFQKGQERKSIVAEIEQQRNFQFEQKRRQNKKVVTTGVIMKTQRKESTINRDISSLVKVGLLKKVGRGQYRLDEEKGFSLESIDRSIIHERKRKK